MSNRRPSPIITNTSSSLQKQPISSSTIDSDGSMLQSAASQYVDADDKFPDETILEDSIELPVPEIEIKQQQQQQQQGVPTTATTASALSAININNPQVIMSTAQSLPALKPLSIQPSLVNEIVRQSMSDVFATAVPAYSSGSLSQSQSDAQNNNNNNNSNTNNSSEQLKSPEEFVVVVKDLDRGVTMPANELLITTNYSRPTFGTGVAALNPLSAHIYQRSKLGGGGGSNGTVNEDSLGSSEDESDRESRKSQDLAADGRKSGSRSAESAGGESAGGGFMRAIKKTASKLVGSAASKRNSLAMVTVAGMPGPSDAGGGGEGETATVVRVKAKGKQKRQFTRLRLVQELMRESPVAPSPHIASLGRQSPSSPQPPIISPQIVISPPGTEKQDGGDYSPHSPSQSGKGAVWVMRFSRDGRFLATGGQDAVLRIWSLASEPAPSATPTHSTPPPSTSPVLPSGDQQQSPKHCEQQQRLTSPDLQAPPPPISRKPSTTGGGSNINNSSRMPPVFNQHPYREYRGHQADILDISWSKNDFILSSSMDKTVRLWHVSRKECLCCFKHSDFVTAIEFHPRDDRFFLSGCLDCRLRLWNVPEKRVHFWNEMPQSNLITAVGFSSDGRFAIAGSYLGTCVFFETDGLRYNTQIHVRSTRGRNARGEKITGIAAFDGGQSGEERILITSNDSRLRLYSLRDKSLVCKYKGLSNYSSQIRASFSDDGQFLISGSEDRFAYIWQTVPGAVRGGNSPDEHAAAAATATTAALDGANYELASLTGDPHRPAQPTNPSTSTASPPPAKDTTAGKLKKDLQQLLVSRLQGLTSSRKDRNFAYEAFEAHSSITTCAIFAPRQVNEHLEQAGLRSTLLTDVSNSKCSSINSLNASETTGRVCATADDRGIPTTGADSGRDRSRTSTAPTLPANRPVTSTASGRIIVTADFSGCIRVYENERPDRSYYQPALSNRHLQPVSPHLSLNRKALASSPSSGIQVVTGTSVIMN